MCLVAEAPFLLGPFWDDFLLKSIKKNDVDIDAEKLKINKSRCKNEILPLFVKKFIHGQRFVRKVVNAADPLKLYCFYEFTVRPKKEDRK